MDNDPRWKKDGFMIRLAQAEDVDDYYAQNYCPLDKEIARLTGCKAEFTKEEVRSFFLKSLEVDDRYFFLILSPDGRIVGESVINEIDWALRCANFRIGIFHPTVTCSPECGEKHRKIQYNETLIRQGKRITPADEAYNSGLPKSGIVGVTYNRRLGRWEAKHKGHYIGIYPDVDTATAAIEDYKEDKEI